LNVGHLRAGVATATRISMGWHRGLKPTVRQTGTAGILPARSHQHTNPNNVFFNRPAEMPALPGRRDKSRPQSSDKSEHSKPVSAESKIRQEKSH